jgi:hypothetical protein
VPNLDKGKMQVAYTYLFDDYTTQGVTMIAMAATQLVVVDTLEVGDPYTYKLFPNGPLWLQYPSFQPGVVTAFPWQKTTYADGTLAPDSLFTFDKATLTVTIDEHVAAHYITTEQTITHIVFMSYEYGGILSIYSYRFTIFFQITTADEVTYDDGRDTIHIDFEWDEYYELNKYNSTWAPQAPYGYHSKDTDGDSEDGTQTDTSSSSYDRKSLGVPETWSDSKILKALEWAKNRQTDSITQFKEVLVNEDGTMTFEFTGKVNLPSYLRVEGESEESEETSSPVGNTGRRRLSPEVY